MEKKRESITAEQLSWYLLQKSTQAIKKAMHLSSNLSWTWLNCKNDHLN